MCIFVNNLLELPALEWVSFPWLAWAWHDLHWLEQHGIGMCGSSSTRVWPTWECPFWPGLRILGILKLFSVIMAVYDWKHFQSCYFKVPAFAICKFKVFRFKQTLLTHKIKVMIIFRPGSIFVVYLGACFTFPPTALATLHSHVSLLEEHHH